MYNRGGESHSGKGRWVGNNVETTSLSKTPKLVVFDEKMMRGVGGDCITLTPLPHAPIHRTERVLGGGNGYKGHPHEGFQCPNTTRTVQVESKDRLAQQRVHAGGGK